MFYMWVDAASEDVLSDSLAHVSRLTGAKVRVFLTELAEGTSNYTSLHNLTEHVEHQYHGRFLIELIQNAHDTFEPVSRRANNRIEIVLDSADSTHGTLFVANDGRPFTPSNFERLSQLGQSDKDPQKSIGNKGIGFRSVLEVSECPEIYSRASARSSSFDGYCFAFRPDVVKSLNAPILHLVQESTIPIWSVTGEALVEDWSDAMLRKFRQRVAHEDEGWLAAESEFLSPYLLPVPLMQRTSSCIDVFEARGLSTVIRLPLKSADMRKRVMDCIDELDGGTMLFLEKLTSLRIRCDGEDVLSCTRRAEPAQSDSGGERVIVSTAGGEARDYNVWKQDLHVSQASDAFRAAIAALPGRWPEIKDISVSVAVRLGDEPETGRFNIYLPTRVATGSAVHISAPFFGDMSRTSIDFKNAYNSTLLNTATDLIVRIVREHLAGKNGTEARVIVDCLAPFGGESASEDWIGLIDAAAQRRSAHRRH
jgi:hypothetical protein